MIMIPLNANLTAFLENVNNFSVILREYQKHKETSNILSSIVNGPIWQEKVKFIDGADYIFPINLYYDDIEIGNPLGSHSGVQKLGVIYATIPLVPIKFASKLENIFIVSLFYSND